MKGLRRRTEVGEVFGGSEALRKPLNMVLVQENGRLEGVSGDSLRSSWEAATLADASVETLSAKRPQRA